MTDVSNVSVDLYLMNCICTALLKGSGFGWKQSYWNCMLTWAEEKETQQSVIKSSSVIIHDYSSQNMQNITIIPGSAEKTIITQTREVGAYLFKVIACL